MKVRLKVSEPATQYASDLDTSTWFLDQDSDVSLIINDQGSKKVLCFGGNPFIRSGQLDGMSVHRVLDPDELEICE